MQKPNKTLEEQKWYISLIQRLDERRWKDNGNSKKMTKQKCKEVY